MLKRKPFHSLCALVLMLCMGFGSTAVMAQSQASSGQIAGVVIDSQGAAVPNAAVKATNTQTGLERSANSSDEGLYSIVLLPPGIYRVSAEASGFSAVTVDNVEVTVGRTIDVKLQLGVSGVQEVVNVTAGAIQVQTTRSEADSVVNERAITNLPINGRRFQDFVTLTPTAQVDPQRGQISLSGQRGIYGANINVDGVDYNQPFFGGIRGGERSNTAFTIPQESIKEFQVIASGYSAEFGRSTGGIVNAVTKSGTNDLHGSAFYLARPKNFARKNEFFKALEDRVNQIAGGASVAAARREIKPAPTQQQFGGSMGGPVKKDRIFWFAAIEFQKVNQDRETLFPDLIGFTPGPATQEAFDFFQGIQGPFRVTNDAIALLGRIDYEINSNHRFNVRYSYSRNNAENANATGNALFPNTVSALSNNGTEKDRTNTVVGQFASILSPTVVNEFRGQYSREQRPRDTNSELPTFTTSFGRFGAVNFLPTTQFDWRVQLADSVSVTRNNHAFKVGGEYNRTFADQLFGFNQFGSYSVAGSTVSVILDQLSFSPGFTPPTGQTTTLNRFDNTAVSYLRQIGNRQASFGVTEVAFFGQDAWRVRPNLTINYGLRWEGQYNPAPDASNDALVARINGFRFPSGHVVDVTKINDSTNQWGPRAGFAWDPWGDTKTVIRGYGGVYYARSPSLLFASAVNNFRNPPGDVSVRLPFSTSSLPTTNPLRSCTTIYCQAKLVGIDFNTFTLGNLPNITPEQIQSISRALGLSIDPFFNANVQLIAPDFKNPKSYQAGIGIERQVSKSLTLGADFNYVHTIHLQRNRDLNLPLPLSSISEMPQLADPTKKVNIVDPAQRPFFGLRGSTASTTPADQRYAARPRPIPSLGSIEQRESTGRALYRALTLRSKFQRKWGQFNMFYTLSKSLSDDDNERDSGGRQFENSFNYGPEYGPARLDRRHQFVANPVFFLPKGFDVASAIRLRSGRPIDASIGFDANEDIGGPDRPFLAPGQPFQRNMFRNKALYDVDVRVQKRLNLGETKRLIFTVETFNLFNLKNIEINDNGGTNAGVTNYCVAVGGLTPRDCGFGAPTNVNFLQLRDRLPNATTFGKLLLTNNPGSPFQMQFGARFQF
jgi:outer membrane receptor for ferrienterochelin and colicin